MQPLSSHINRDLGAKALQLAELTEILRASLPQNCQPHVTVAGIRDQQLILVTDSPVWLSRLRMYTHSMLEMLARHSQVKITQIRIKQTPQRITRKPPPPGKHRHLDARSSELIAQTADSIDDPQLQQALYKLSRNTRRGK